MLSLFQKSIATLSIALGVLAFAAPQASASPCPSGNCNLQVAPQSCKRVEVVGAPRVNLRSTNRFGNNSNVIGVTYAGDVFKLKRCTKRGCKIILKTDQGNVGAWIHSGYVNCTRKKKYQQCGLYSVNGNSNAQSYNRQSYTSNNGRVTIHFGRNGVRTTNHHHHHHGGSATSYGNLRINFNISASVH